VQKLPVAFTYSAVEDLSDGVADKFTVQTGTWTTTSGTTGRYTAVPPASDAALSTRPLAVAALSYVEFSATVNASAAGVTAGLAFDVTSANDFLYAGVIAGTNQVVLGHRSNGVWYVDATANATINAGSDYTLMVAISEQTTGNVTVVLNGASVLSFGYTYLLHEGSVGLFAKGGAASFDNVLLRGDDVAYAAGGTPQYAASAAVQAAAPGSVDATGLSAVVATALQLWSDALDPSDPRRTELGLITVLVSDLPGDLLGATTGTTIVIDTDAAGRGWFVDPVASDPAAFALTNRPGISRATPDSPAFGHMDLLSTVLHEIGNVLGFSETSGDEVAGRTLDAGERRLPVATPGRSEPTHVSAPAPLFFAGTEVAGPGVPETKHGTEASPPATLFFRGTEVATPDVPKAKHGTEASPPATLIFGGTEVATPDVPEAKHGTEVSLPATLPAMGPAPSVPPNGKGAAPAIKWVAPKLPPAGAADIVVPEWVNDFVVAGAANDAVQKANAAMRVRAFTRP